MLAHFQDMLRYLDDNPLLWEILGYGGPDLNTEAVRNYLEENGLQVYGLSLVASRDELLKLETQELVSLITTTPY